MRLEASRVPGVFRIIDAHTGLPLSRLAPYCTVQFADSDAGVLGVLDLDRLLQGDHTIRELHVPRVMIDQVRRTVIFNLPDNAVAAIEISQRALRA